MPTFQEVDQQYFTLKRQYDSGSLSADAFDAQLKALMIEDDTGLWWAKDRTSGGWHVYEGNTWISRVPPAYAAAGQYAPTASPPSYGYAPYGGGSFASTQQATNLAGFWVRVGAYLIDALVLLIPGLLLNFVVKYVGATIIDAVYFVAMWMRDGQTLGMKAVNIRVVRVDGQKIDVMTGIIRYIGIIIGSLALLLGLLWVIWDPNKQGWHDKMANTLVVRT